MRFKKKSSVTWSQKDNGVAWSCEWHAYFSWGQFTPYRPISCTFLRTTLHGIYIFENRRNCGERSLLSWYRTMQLQTPGFSRQMCWIGWKLLRLLLRRNTYLLHEILFTIDKKQTNLACISVFHSGAKWLVWFKNCCHIWLDQSFDQSLLTNKLWLVFMGKKNQNGRLKNTRFFKIDNSRQYLVKIPWIGRIDWCQRRWCSSTYALWGCST